MIEKYTSFIEKQSKIVKLFFLIFYVLLTFVTFSLYLSYIFIESGIYLGITESDLDNLLAAFIFSFFFSLLIPSLLKPTLDLIEPNKGKQAIYIVDKENDSKKWYILHPSKNYILLGNEKEEFLCTKKKLVEKEYILNKVIYHEK